MYSSFGLPRKKGWAFVHGRRNNRHLTRRLQESGFPLLERPAGLLRKMYTLGTVQQYFWTFGALA
jgi:hypothetical protein